MPCRARPFIRDTAPARTAATTAAARPRQRGMWIAVLAAMIGAFMAILNIQITNASLLDIEGGIGTGVDNGSWISTSYLIGEIVVIPLTDYLSRVFSFRNIMLAHATLFAAFSVACAFTHDLPSMIAMRGLQGFFGGVLIPMAFTHGASPGCRRRQQPIGLAMFALAVTFAPAIGPTIGGYLTENYGWQTIFFVNVVPTAVMVDDALLHAGAAADAAQACCSEGDWLGIATMAIGLSALQAVLEEGNKDDWFGSPFIVKLAVVAADQPDAVRLDRAHRGEAADPAAAADAAQLRLRHHLRGRSSASRCSDRSICCRPISARCSTTMPSRSARCWPGPACRS